MISHNILFISIYYHHKKFLIIFCSELIISYKLDFLKIFANLTQAHSCVRKHFSFLYFFVEDLSENHLESHRDSCLF